MPNQPHQGGGAAEEAAPDIQAVLLEALETCREAAHPLLGHHEDRVWRRAKIVVDVADQAIRQAIRQATGPDQNRGVG